MIRNILIYSFALFTGAVQAQQIEAIQFEETTHDFGTVKEEGGPITYEFKFVNNSVDSMRIVGVKASCGCTTPGWSKEAVAPGKSGFIKAQYNPKNRPGSFNKSLTVTTDLAENPVKRLYIKGQVTPKPKTTDEEYTTLMGGLRVKHNSFNLGKVLTKEEPTSRTYEVYNATDSTISFIDKIDKPEYITVHIEPRVLEPKAKGKISIEYDGKKRGDWGFLTDNIALYTDEDENFSQKSFTVYATIEEYFPPMTPQQYAKAPQLKIENALHDFGKIKEGEKTTATYTLKNNGLTVLNIRAVKSTCSCVVANLQNENVAPGKTTTLEVTFDAVQRRGNQQKSITIFSNDPKKPMQRATIKGVVVVE